MEWLEEGAENHVPRFGELDSCSLMEQAGKCILWCPYPEANGRTWGWSNSFTS